MNTPIYRPAGGWRTSTPEEQGVGAELLTDAAARLRRGFPGILSFVLIKNGCIVWDYQNARPYESPGSRLLRGALYAGLTLLGKPRATFSEDYKGLHNLRSATKSILSLLLGIALDQGLIGGVDDAMADYLPERYIKDLDSAKRQITLRQLLTMRSGLASIENNLNSVKMLFGGGDWVRFIIKLPMTSPPGERFLYNSANAHLLSAVISHAANMSARDFAETYLFGPLGITDFFWESDGKGINFGAGNLFLSPYDMAKLGYLCLSGGIRDGRAVVSDAWLRESLQSRHDWGYGYRYGYLWYIQTVKTDAADIELYSAAGAGGQRIYFVPALDLVVAATARTSLTGDKSHVLNGVVEDIIRKSSR